MDVNENKAAFGARPSVKSCLEVKVVPPCSSRPAPTFNIRKPWENSSGHEVEAVASETASTLPIPKTGRPTKEDRRGRRAVKPRPLVEAKSKISTHYLRLPVNNPDLPKCIERDNSFMLPSDDPNIKKLFGDLRDDQRQVNSETTKQEINILAKSNNGDEPKGVD
eukprot:CAMPEP_0185264190 /NCGR_PEP_ID=MMETSP1359-20130426/20302_1 /TAXON_ID=552665 /ORGANISM="Bigelowiella longifila, Strain CCMP242" /LENGTH=164 /DNA_ID=CAMNT_0027852479 /DNA_START=122 /DNA_END=613 /DNA_ORIENTATION=-